MTIKKKHLWEVDHPYYCNKHNYFDNGCAEEYSSWKDFHDAEGDADIDMNLVFRWDWSKPNKDNELDDEVLELFIIGQRKGIFRTVTIKVTAKDERSIIAYLRPRLDRLLELWKPLT